MIQNAFDTLKERGFIAQTNDEAAIRAAFGAKQLTYYIGFDPTAN